VDLNTSLEDTSRQTNSGSKLAVYRNTLPSMIKVGMGPSNQAVRYVIR